MVAAVSGTGPVHPVRAATRPVANNGLQDTGAERRVRARLVRDPNARKVGVQKETDSLMLSPQTRPLTAIRFVVNS